MDNLWAIVPIVLLVIVVILSIPRGNRAERHDIAQRQSTDLARRNAGRETWTDDELSLPGVIPGRTDMTKAEQIKLAREGRLVRRTILMRGHYPGLTVDHEPEVVDGEIMPDDAPQLNPRNPQRGRLLPRSDRSKKLLGG